MVAWISTVRALITKYFSDNVKGKMIKSYPPWAGIRVDITAREIEESAEMDHTYVVI